MRLLPAIIANVVLAVAAIGFGNLFRSWIPKSFSQLDRVVLTLLGGLGLLGTILFCVGQVWFSRTAIVLVLLLGVLLSLRPLAQAIRNCRPAFAKLSLPALPAGIVLLVMVLTAVGGLALPTGDMNDDAIAYHYLGPRVWLQNGVIRPVPDEIETYFPVVVEAQYAALMSLGGQRAPGFFAVIGFGALLLMSGSLAIRLGLDPTGAWWAAALVAAMPAVYRGAYGGFLDALFAAFVLAAARMAFDMEQPGQFALFGIFCGICMGTKYTGIIAWVLLVSCSFLVLAWAYRPKTSYLLKWLGVSCAVAIVLAFPFYLRNWIVCGSPFYPAFPALLKWFTPNYLQPAAIQDLTRAMRIDGQGMGGGVWNFLLLPFHLTFHTADFRGAGGIGLAPLALGPLGMIARRRDPFALGLFLFAVLQVGAWFVTAQVARYMIHVYVIGAIFGVLGWNYAVKIASRNGRVLSEVVIAISILYGLWMIVPVRLEDLHAVVSPSFEAKRWERETPRAASFDYLNHEPSVKKVLILDLGIAAYFLDKPYIKPFGRWGEQTLGAADVPQVLSLLPSLHVTHILDVKEEDGAFALPEHPPGFTLVFEHGDQRIYRIDHDTQDRGLNP
jgi:hypothetical protein